jgi:tetratricopeptide (TPR) repeat protein
MNAFRSRAVMLALFLTSTAGLVLGQPVSQVPPADGGTGGNKIDTAVTSKNDAPEGNGGATVTPGGKDSAATVIPEGDAEVLRKAEQSRRFSEFYHDYARELKLTGGHVSAKRMAELAAAHHLDPHSSEVRDRLRKISQAGDDAFGRISGVANPDPQNTLPKRAEVNPGSSPLPSQTVTAPVVRPSQEVVNFVDNVNVQDSGGSPGALKERGLDQGLQGNYKGAYQDLGAVVRSGDPDPKTLDAYGDAALHLGDYATALNAANAALQIDPNDRSAFSLKKFAEAEAGAPKVRLPSSLGELASNPSPGEMPAGSGLVPLGGALTPGGGLFQGPPPSGMTAEQALALAKQAAAPGSDAPKRSMEFTKDAANAMRVKDYPTAYQLSSQAINLNPQNAQALNYRAMTLSQMRRYSDAVQDASSALGLAPGNAAVLHTRSWAFSKEKK